MKNRLNAFYFGATPRYYLTHPHKWVKELIHNIKNSYDRITKGYCYLDWCDLDMWFKFIMPQMLHELAENGHAYPGAEPFDTPKKWQEWLFRMAAQLAACQDEDNGNEYYEQFIDLLMKNPLKSLDRENETPEEKELRTKYYKRSLEVMEEHKTLFQNTMTELIQHWDCLWD